MDTPISAFIFIGFCIIWVLFSGVYFAAQRNDNAVLFGANKKTLIILLWLVFAIAVFSYQNLTQCDCECWVRKNVTSDDYKGKIIVKYHGEKGEPMIILNDSRELHLNNHLIFDTITPKNDYIIKYAGSLKHWLIHNGDTILFYPICNIDGWHEVRDGKILKSISKN
jgi:hypothetical protein